MLRFFIPCCLAALSGAAAAQSETVFLGRASQPTRIYAAPNSHSRIFAHVRSSEYLYIRNSPKADWLEVLMRNGIYAYVPAKAVTELPQDYTVNRRPSRSDSSLASRSGYGYSRSEVALGPHSDAASEATRYLGTPYKWGGTDEYSGIDCSAFVKKMYGKIGIELPRTAAEQALVGEPITRLEQLRKGDRLYFCDKSRHRIDHTGMYMGDGTFIHSSHGKGGVAITPLTRSWLSILVAARR